MQELDAKEKDDRIIVRIQKRLVRLKNKYRTWRRVGAVLEVNHFYLNYVMQGNVPKSEKVRKALGFPRRLPSERKPRERRPNWREGMEDYLERLR